jgi:hypothetical protein
MFVLPASAQECLAPFEFLVGSWSGHETGVAGIGRGTRTYELILDGKYLHAKNTSRFEPQEKNPKGETHNDWQFISCDKMRGKVILREFHSEGFVNQYVLETSASPDTFVVVSEALENSPPGLRARLTISKVSNDKFTEQFELAFPNKDFGVLLKNEWTRQK